MKNYGIKQQTNRGVISTSRQRLAAWLVCVSIGANVLTASASLRFNGTDSKAVLDGHYLDGGTHSAYTFEVWVKPYTLKEANILGKTEYWKAFWISTFPDGGVYLAGEWPYFYWGTKTAVGSLTTNVWQHICCAVTNGTASFYVNGIAVGTAPVHDPISFNPQYPSGSAPSLDAGMSIGYADSGTTPDYAFFNGLIYGIKVWSRTLASNEVYAIATTGVPLTTNGLSNAVMLDEGSGTVIRDSLTSLSGRVLTAQWSSDSPQLPCSPHRATATASLINGFVIGATVTDPGCGYTNAPTVLIQRGGGSGATATATVSGGQVTAINITSAGFGYTNVPTVVIGSPPFVPTVSIAVSKVKVTQHVVLGRSYVLEASPDLVTWTATGPQFTADSETIVNEFDVDVTGRFFRLRQVP